MQKEYQVERSMIECANNHYSVSMVVIKKDENAILCQCPTCLRKLRMELSEDQGGSLIKNMVEMTDNKQPDKSIYDAEAMMKNSRINDDVQSFKKRFSTYYEKLPRKLHMPYPLFWLIAGQLVFLIHYIIGIFEGESGTVISDFSLLLCSGISISYILSFFGLNLLDRFYVDYSKMCKGSQDEVYEKFEKYLSIIYKPYYLIAGAIMATAMVLSVYFIAGTWYVSHVLSISYLVIIFLNGIALGNGMWIGLASIYLIFNINKSEIKIDINHPDRVGGLKYLGKLSMKYSLIMIFVVFVYVAVLLFTPWVNKSAVFWTAFYAFVSFAFITSVLVFIIPLISIHAKIREYKDFEIYSIEIEMDRILEKSWRKSKSMSIKQISLGAGEVEDYSKLISLKEQISSLSEWPFDLSIIGQLFGGLLIPVILLVLEKIV